MTDEQKLIFDLEEVCRDLAQWAKDYIDCGHSARDVLDMLRDAVAISGRDSGY
jgi:hypothetical protein